MKSVSRALSVLLILGCVLTCDTDASAARRKRARRNPPPPRQNQNKPQNQSNKPKGPQGPKVVAFKDLRDNADFYFASDTGHNIRYTKLSATTARSAVGAVNRVSQVVPIAANQQVISVAEIERVAKKKS